MEEMREIVRSYYARESEADKKSIKQSFTEIDVNGDGNISLAEFKKAMSSTDGVVALFFFNKLDLNDDGCLDFDEFLCLYYIVNKKVPIPLCDGCREFPAGPYFSCLRCVGRGANSYDLCCSCYRSGAELSHEHSLEDMVDHHCIIKLFKDEKAKNKKEIEEIREIAIALHRGSSPEVQELATVFFQAMDSDGDGRVDLSEFLAFMTEVGLSYKKTSSLFDVLDIDGNGTLDFTEVMTLLYIIKSGCPQCDCCGKIIPGVFFSCVECFMNPKTSFDLCKDCYGTGRYHHKHGGRAQFLDSHTLLQAMRCPIADMSRVTIDEAGNRSTDAISNPKWSKRKAAYTAFDIACKVGTFSNAVGLCTIM